MITTSFDPKKQGFHFDNGTFGGTFSVLCGGMSYATMDYLQCGMNIPELRKAPATGNPLHDYLYRRQCTAHYYTWHLFAVAWSSPFPLIGGVTSGLSQGSFADLEYYLTPGGPLVMCLYGGVAKGHHVLAIGCDRAKQTIDLYDNNFHDKRSTLTLQNGAWAHSGGSTWKGWFLDWGHYTDGAKMPPLACRYCSRCHGLYATSFGKVGQCNAGGSHSGNMDFEYFLPCFTNEGERGWRLCQKCNTLFYSPSGQATGWCADGGNHSPAIGGGEALDFGIADSGDEGEKGWYRCNLCYSLFWGGNGNGNCRVGGTHEKSTKQYAVDYRTV
jgi:hypothetical protein